MAFHMLDRPVSAWTQPEVPVFGYTAPQTTAPVIFKPLDGSRTTKPVNVAHTSLENQEQEHRRAVYANKPFCNAAKREPEPEPEPKPPKVKKSKDPLARLKQAMEKNIV